MTNSLPNDAARLEAIRKRLAGAALVKLSYADAAGVEERIEFIIHAATDLAYLLAEHDRLVEERDRYSALVTQHCLMDYASLRATFEGISQENARLTARVRELEMALREGLEHMHPLTCASMDGYEDSGKPCDCWQSRAQAALGPAPGAGE